MQELRTVLLKRKEKVEERQRLQCFVPRIPDAHNPTENSHDVCNIFKTNRVLEEVFKIFRFLGKTKRSNRRFRAASTNKTPGKPSDGRTTPQVLLWSRNASIRRNLSTQPRTHKFQPAF